MVILLKAIALTSFFKRLEENEKLMAQQLKQQQQQQQHRRSPSLEPPPRLLSSISEEGSPTHLAPASARITTAPPPAPLPEVSSPPRLGRSVFFFRASVPASGCIHYKRDSLILPLSPQNAWIDLEKILRR
jgi:hypothetical protein